MLCAARSTVFPYTTLFRSRSAAAAWPELRAYRTTLAFDDEESVMLELYNVVVANGRYVAGGTLIAPEAAIDDGLLRSEEHTSELQSRFDIVCRLLLEKKNL